uniref:Putative secreted protein n=1 Tax=Anopheles triannulatus TaxID=58253 RepID=A0A2M4B7W2_9DIPT
MPRAPSTVPDLDSTATAAVALLYSAAVAPGAVWTGRAQSPCCSPPPEKGCFWKGQGEWGIRKWQSLLCLGRI